MVNSNLKIYDSLLQFTLFQGMSHNDLMEVVTHTKIGFHKIPSGKKLFSQGENCHQLTFLLSGTIDTIQQADNKAYDVTERMSAPFLIGTEHLFGINQQYPCTYSAATPLHLITIDKQEVILLLETQLVFRLNMLNLIATTTQRLLRQPWRSAPHSLRDSIVRFFFAHCHYPAGHKTFHIRMQQLADILHYSRLDVSRALNIMQADGLLSLHRSRIEIPMLERLLM